jgi:hypothetical protein
MALNLELDKSILLYDTRYSLAKSVPIKETAKEDFIYQPTRLKAVDQKPAPGTLIATGSKVIVYFEDTDSMSIDIYEGAHAGYTGRTAKEVVDKVKADEGVKKIIEKTEKSEDLTAEEEVIMVNFFVEDLGLEMNESDPTRNKKAAYDVIVAAYDLMK